MTTRSRATAVFTAVVLIALFVVLFFVSKSSYYPSISSLSSKYPIWYGYSPLTRLFYHQDDTVPSNNSNISSPVQPNLFRMLWSIFSNRSVPAASPAPSSLPQNFHTSRIAGIDLAHHNPFSASELSGVALLLHACGQSASDWFVLPENRRLTSELLRRRLAVIAVSSTNRVTQCWSTRYPAARNSDAVRVRLAVRQWSVSQGISHDTPFYAIGVSSGASFLSVLAATEPPFVPSLAAQAFYLSPGNPRAVRNASGATFPNTIFVRAQADSYYAPPVAIALSRIALLGRHVPLVAEMPLPLETWTETSIHEHEPLVTKEESVSIFHYLPACYNNFECAVKKAGAVNESMVRLWDSDELKRSLTQVSRVLEGKHELSAAHSEYVVEWLLRNGRSFVHVDH